MPVDSRPMINCSFGKEAIFEMNFANPGASLSKAKGSTRTTPSESAAAA